METYTITDRSGDTFTMRATPEEIASGIFQRVSEAMQFQDVSLKKGDVFKKRKISYRLFTGWEKGVNMNADHCDICGSKLWGGPGNTVYCDAVHSIAEVEEHNKMIGE